MYFPVFRSTIDSHAERPPPAPPPPPVLTRPSCLPSKYILRLKVKAILIFPLGRPLGYDGDIKLDFQASSSLLTSPSCLLIELDDAMHYFIPYFIFPHFFFVGVTSWENIIDLDR